MKPSKGKQLIIEGCRELFPQILPCQLQEARQKLLDHLGLSRESFGFYPSGSSKFDNYCSQVVKTLKTNGEMTTNGWEWSWVGTTGHQVETPVQQMVIETTDQEDDFLGLLDDDLFETPTQTPSLYNLDCEDTLIRVIAITSCFGKGVLSDPECQSCPLFDHCLEKTGDKKRAQKVARANKAEVLSIALESGYDLKGVKVPKSARLHEALELPCTHPLPCVVSGEVLQEGERITHIPSWGMMKKIIADTFIALNS